MKILRSTTGEKLTRHELEFLPAVLEIQETPPSPLGRTVVWALIALFTIVIAWACIGKVDIVAIARGKIVPGDRVKLIQPLEIGTVRAIHVREGESVVKGQVLIDLDTTSTGADRERLASELMATRLDAARLRALSAGRDAVDPKDIPTDADASAIDLQQQILRDQVREQEARLSGMEGTVKQRKAEHATTMEIIKKLEATLPLVTRRTEAVKALTEQRLAPEQSYLELEQQRIEQQQDLAAQRNHLQAIFSGIAEAEQRWQVQQAEFRRTVLADLSDAMDRVAFLTQELVKAERRNSAQRLISPVSGIVQQLAVHTVGGIVMPAQQLMIVVPEEHELEVEAAVLNQDIGFVRNGQQAEIKVETFPFTKYGTIDAEIMDVSDDAVSDEALGLVYTARVLMKKSVMQVEDRLVKLAPGMSVTVEIKTGKRRLIEYFLSPLLQYSKESVRER